ncbi:hypothetical protein B0H13DRAFT_1918649 [Mycena leptocephala]|nr:hypothetical protein B0H13DRAFT_1918649 [Mycena leptocephala]
MRQPDLDQGQRRIIMKRSEDVDHLNMKSWTGHAIAGDCHVPSVWKEGCKIAQQIFAKLRFPADSYDYPTIFSDPEVDMMRPFGENKYPGVDDTHAPSPSPSPAPAPSTEHPADFDNDDDIEDQGDGIELEESLDEVPELALPSGPGVDPDDYISVEGEWVHKQRICRVFISADFEPKSTERLKRVRGHTKVNAKKRDNVNPAAILGANTFIVGDHFFTLLRTDQTLSLAVVRWTAIHDNGISRGSILAQTIRDPQAKVKLSGQIVTMTMIPTIQENLAESDNALTSSWSWIWNGEYLKADSAMAGTSITTEKVVIVSVPGELTQLVNPRQVDAVLRLGQAAYQMNCEVRSWEIDDGVMGVVCELLWQAIVQKKQIALTAIASVKKSKCFPYSFDNGNYALVCHPGPSSSFSYMTTKQPTMPSLRLFKSRELARPHLGPRVRRIRGVDEALRIQILSQFRFSYSNRPECAIHLRKKGATTQVETNCTMVVAFNYKPAEQGSKTTPCRNLPVVCTICFPDVPRPGQSQRAQWRYNMPEHLAKAVIRFLVNVG